MVPDFGKILIFLGLVLIVLGVFFWAGSHIPWFGKLPGDMSFKKDGFSFYFPLTTCLLISAGLSLLIYLFRK